MNDFTADRLAREHRADIQRETDRATLVAQARRAHPRTGIGSSGAATSGRPTLADRWRGTLAQLVPGPLAHHGHRP